MPEGDILIHAGDFTSVGKTKEIIHFNKFLSSLTSFKHKIVIAGNHDLTLDRYDKEGLRQRFF